MSTNKTENYQLHAWEPGDDFLLSEFNANFAAIDTVLAKMPQNKKLKIVAGSYTGIGGGGVTITLPFTPKVVYACNAPSANDARILLLVDGTDTKFGQIVENGFQAKDYMNIDPKNTYGGYNPYRYIAFWWADEE